MPLLVALQAVWEDPSYHGDYHWSLCGPSLSQLFAHAPLQLQVRKCWVKSWAMVKASLCPNTEPFPLTAWEGRLEGQSYWSGWACKERQHLCLEYWVFEAKFLTEFLYQIPYRNTQRQKRFNLGCLHEFRRVTVTLAVELHVQRHAAPGISNRERLQVNFSL